MQEVSTMADDFYKLYCEEVEKKAALAASQASSII